MGFKDYVAGAAGGTLGFIGANVPGAIVGGYYGYKASKEGLGAAGKEFGTKAANYYLPPGLKIKGKKQGFFFPKIQEWLIYQWDLTDMLLLLILLVVMYLHRRHGLEGQVWRRLCRPYEEEEEVRQAGLVEVLREEEGLGLDFRGSVKRLLNIKLHLKVLKLKMLKLKKKR